MAIFDTLALIYICLSGVYIIYKIYVSSRDGWDRKGGLLYRKGNPPKRFALSDYTINNSSECSFYHCCLLLTKGPPKLIDFQCLANLEQVFLSCGFTRSG